jgi:hypothetical protein
MKLRCILFLSTALLGPFTASAITVLNANDSGAGSLRQTIIDAAAGDTITFTNTLVGQTIILTTGQLLIDKDLDIDASGIGGITIDGNANGRMFAIAAGNTAVFDSLILTNGNSGGYAGAIHVDVSAELTLENSTLSGNFALYGGAIANYGTVMINNSTFSGNISADSSSSFGHAIYNGGVLIIYSSTISGNTEGRTSGGCIFNEHVLVIHSSTVSGNRGGINNESFGALILTNTIVAGNSGYDIEGSFGGSNNLTSGDPKLMPLGDYGGLTQTMPPLYNSSAIDGGLDTGSLPATDQRGMVRVLAGDPAGSPIVDIGAVEYSGWLGGADLSATDPEDFNLSNTIYNSSTVFPGGFDPDAAGMLAVLSPSEQNDLIAQGETMGESNVTNNPAAYGLYTESAFQALALDRPFLSYDSISNKFTLTIGVLQAPDLFTTFSNLTGFTTIPYPGDGQVDIEFDPPNSEARFFEVYGSEPPSP